MELEIAAGPSLPVPEAWDASLLFLLSVGLRLGELECARMMKVGKLWACVCTFYFLLRAWKKGILCVYNESSVRE